MRVPPRRNPDGAEGVDGVLGALQAIGHGRTEGFAAAGTQRVPEEERGDRVAGTADGGVEGADVFDRPGDPVDVGLAREDDSARQRTPDHLVTRDRDAVDAVGEIPRRRIVDEGQDHAGKRGIDVEVVVRQAEALRDRADAVDAVDRTGHRRARVDEEDRRGVAVDAEAFLEILVVDLPVGLRPDHDVPAMLEPQDLRDAVVGVLRKVDDSLGEELAGEVETVHVPLGAAVGDVAPVGAAAPSISSSRKPVKRANAASTSRSIAWVLSR